VLEYLTKLGRKAIPILSVIMNITGVLDIKEEEYGN